MENTTPTAEKQLNQLSEVDRRNLELLHNLGEFYEKFTDHAKSINEVFFMYVHTCLHTQEQLQISQNDVYNILEVVKLLNELQFTKN